MKKMTIMIGLPGSGKSTTAFDIMNAEKNTVRINRDLLRKMLHFSRADEASEKKTKEAAKILARMFLSGDVNVIIDDTNLTKGSVDGWKDLARETGADIDIIDLSVIPVETCVFRDSEREEPVGGVVIKNMALKSGLKKFAPDSVVVCDIDGTIADISHRLHYVDEEAHKENLKKQIAEEKEKREKEKKSKKKKKAEAPVQEEVAMPVEWKKDYDKFYSLMPYDAVRRDIQGKLIKYYNEGKTVIFLTGRPDKYRDVTLSWLSNNFLTFAYTVIMRRTGDTRKDTETKRELLEQHFSDLSVVHAILEDRPSVVRVWQEMKLPVIDVGNQKEF